ncbi:MAG: HAD-IA family hydrolase [Lachnospiraceae bacterium]|nr:HAD-IA family hydrolase [Lachnospiraceae bacterium]
MNTKAVIFDLDDTLYPEVSYCLSGYRKTAEYIAGKYGGDPEGIYEELERLFREDAGMVFNRYLEAHGISYEKADVMEMIKVYREHRPEIFYHKDAMPAVKALKELGVKTGILSDGFATAQRHKCEALKAYEIFDIVVLTDEIGKDREAWKPSPIGFEKICAEFGAKPQEVIYVGDNPKKDFYVSRTAGVRTARITRADGVYRNEPYFEGVRETYELKNLEDIVRYL